MHELELPAHSPIRQLLEALRALPGAEAHLKATEETDSTLPYRCDAVLHLTLFGNSITVLVHAKKTAFPRDVREMLWQLKKAGASFRPNARKSPAIPLLAAESLSAGAKQLLREEGIGYFDSGGSLFLPAKGAYLLIDKPAPKALAKSVRSLFAGRRAQVLQVMLHSPREWCSVKNVAEVAQVSPATASGTLAELERFDWVTARGRGPAKERSLSEPSALLDAWAQQISSQRSPTVLRYYVPITGSQQLSDRIARACEAHQAQYALTAEVAAQRYAPFISSISQVHCRLLNSRAAERVMEELDARAVTEGANLLITQVNSPGEFLYSERVGEAWLASPIQVYLDLLQGKGRAKEMAAHLRREKIGF